MKDPLIPWGHFKFLLIYASFPFDPFERRGMVELWNFLSFWGISIYIRVGRPTQGRRRQTHERDGILPIGRHGVVDTKFDCTGLASAAGPEFGRLENQLDY